MKKYAPFDALTFPAQAPLFDLFSGADEPFDQA